jgi:hypothetical protein
MYGTSMYNAMVAYNTREDTLCVVNGVWYFMCAEMKSGILW